MISQTATLKKDQEAETADLNKIATVIYSFAKDQWSYNPPEDNGKSPETAVMTTDINLNTILKKRQSVPWRGPGGPQQPLSCAVGDHSLIPNEHFMRQILMSVSNMGTSD